MFLRYSCMRKENGTVQFIVYLNVISLLLRIEFSNAYFYRYIIDNHRISKKMSYTIFLQIKNPEFLHSNLNM